MLFRPSPTQKRPFGFVEPCIPTVAPRPPAGPQWLHEIKHDGYRLIARKQGDRVHLFTRRGYDWTDRYPLIHKAVTALRTASVTIDGEAVVCDDAGVAVFEKLHSRAHDGKAFLYAFDLLETRSSRHPPVERKAGPDRRAGAMGCAAASPAWTRCRSGGAGQARPGLQRACRQASAAD
jgi:ATP-dependent DNA ligase